YGWIPLVVWWVYRKKMRDRQFQHEERLKAIQAGQTLPELEEARARDRLARPVRPGEIVPEVELARVRLARMRLIAAVVFPLVIAVPVTVATGLVAGLAAAKVQIPVLVVIWALWALVSVI